MNFEKWVVKLFSIFNRNENDLTLSFFIFQVLTKINWHSGTRILPASVEKRLLPTIHAGLTAYPQVIVRRYSKMALQSQRKANVSSEITYIS